MATFFTMQSVQAAARTGIRRGYRNVEFNPAASQDPTAIETPNKYIPAGTPIPEGHDIVGFHPATPVAGVRNRLIVRERK